jgi:hypothetical protein
MHVAESKSGRQHKHVYTQGITNTHDMHNQSSSVSTRHMHMHTHTSGAVKQATMQSCQPAAAQQLHIWQALPPATICIGCGIAWETACNAEPAAQHAKAAIILTHTQ